MYRIAKLQQHETFNGVAFNAEIQKLDIATASYVKVGGVQQDGNGGCNTYYFTSRDERAAFTAAAETACPECDFEVEDEFTETLIQQYEASRPARR